MNTLQTLLTGGGLVALGGLISGLVTNWLGDRRDQRKYQHEQAMAAEARRQQRLEQAYIELLGYLSHGIERANAVQALLPNTPPDLLSNSERRRIAALVSAYGSAEVRKLLDEWARCIRKLEDADATIRAAEKSPRPSPQVEEQASRELVAIPSYKEAIWQADEVIRERVRQELAGEV